VTCRKGNEVLSFKYNLLLMEVLLAFTEGKHSTKIEGRKMVDAFLIFKYYRSSCKRITLEVRTTVLTLEILTDRK
jgi:hypothetical protein